MNFKELEQYFEQLPDTVLDDAAEIVAETAVELFKESFNTKSFNGVPWLQPQHHKRTGSLLIESGALLNTIKPALISRERIIISAGNQKVNYAKVHNEGFTGWVNVPAHTRNGKKVKAHQKKMNIPQRQFMGKTDELATLIHDRLQAHCNSVAIRIK